MTDPIRVVCYVARSHGLAGLRALMESPRHEVCAVVTHRLEPGLRRAERPDYQDFAALVHPYAGRLYTVDSDLEQAHVIDEMDTVPHDVIVSINWRRVFTARQLAQPTIGGINVHRGALPQYAGPRPLMRAIQNLDQVFVNTAHELTSEIDGGPVLVEDVIRDKRRPSDTDETQFRRVIVTMETRMEELVLAAVGELVRRKGRR